MTNYASVKSCLVAACVGLSACACARPHVIKVKPGGSLEAARDAARALSASDRADGVEIVLAPGVYRIGSTLKLGPQDSGVTWRAGGGRAVVCDGMELKPEQFKPVPEGTPRIDPDARAKVLVADPTDRAFRMPAAFGRWRIARQRAVDETHNLGDLAPDGTIGPDTVLLIEVAPATPH